MMEFSGKVALITGGGNGIGRAASLGFASRGAKVVVVDRDQAAGDATAGIIRQQGGEARFVAADVTKSADVQAYVKAALDAYGAIDCFYNNAGIEGSVAPTAEYDEDMFDRVIGGERQGRVPWAAPRLACDDQTGTRRGCEYRLGGRAGGIAWDARLCRFEACGDRADQDRGGRGGARPGCG